MNLNIYFIFVFQKYTCKLLEDTDNCGKVFKRCLPADEVRRMQDTHIQARIQQFRDDKSVYECPVVKEYIESGRGDKVDESTEGACTVSQVFPPIFYILTLLLVCAPS